MKYDVVSREEDRVEAMGAHAGYRLRLVARRDGLSHRFAVDVAVRGSESEAEVALDDATGRVRAVSADAALEAGYERAVAWIDHEAAMDG